MDIIPKLFEAQLANLPGPECVVFFLGVSEQSMEMHSVLNTEVSKLSEEWEVSSPPMAAELPRLKKKDRNMCPKCHKPWEDHEFAVPAPYCP